MALLTTSDHVKRLGTADRFNLITQRSVVQIHPPQPTGFAALKAANPIFLAGSVQVFEVCLRSRERAGRNTQRLRLLRGPAEAH